MSLNPELNKGDRIVLIHMDNESQVSYGDAGEVKSKAKVFGDDLYGIKWDNGSNLNLLGDTDKWMLEVDFNEMINKKRKLKENNRDSNFRIANRIPMLKHFNHRFLYEYLLKLRETGIVNMMGAAPYLWIGRDRLSHEMKYKDLPNEDAFEELLDMSDQAQAEMINGTISIIEEKGDEPDLDKINREIKRNAREILRHYIDILS